MSSISLNKSLNSLRNLAFINFYLYYPVERSVKDMTKTVKEVFSTNLRNKLVEKNKSQADLARFCGVSQTSASHWVNGEILPRPKMIDKICVFLSCTSDDLMIDHSKTVALAPEDIIAEELRDNPRLMKLMLYAMKLSDTELDALIARIRK